MLCWCISQPAKPILSLLRPPCSLPWNTLIQCESNWLSDLINRGPGQWARGNISGPCSATINLEPSIQWLKYKEQTRWTVQVLQWLGVPTCYISPYVSISLGVCVCVLWLCVYMDSMIYLRGICSKVGMAFNLAPRRRSQGIKSLLIQYVLSREGVFLKVAVLVDLYISVHTAGFPSVLTSRQTGAGSTLTGSVALCLQPTEGHLHKICMQILPCVCIVCMDANMLTAMSTSVRICLHQW